MIAKTNKEVSLKSVQIEEKSIQLAVVKAAGQLGVTQQELEYKVIEEKKGILGFFGKKILIEAWSKQKGRHHRKRRGATVSRQRKEDETPMTGEEIDALVDEMGQFMKGLCAQIVGEEVEITTNLKGKKLIVDVLNDDIAAMISKSTKTAESFEHLLRKKPKQLLRELPFRIFVDANGIRQNRENKLIAMAQDLSNKVHENSKPIVLNYNSPYDRKIIHMALDQDERVQTKSIGSGPSRRLMILPRREPTPASAR